MLIDGRATGEADSWPKPARSFEGLRSGRESAEGYVAALNLARVYAGLGDADRAFEQLEIAYSKREPWILALRVSPGFDTIRDDRGSPTCCGASASNRRSSPSFDSTQILRKAMDMPAAGWTPMWAPLLEPPGE